MRSVDRAPLDVNCAVLNGYVVWAVAAACLCAGFLAGVLMESVRHPSPAPDPTVPLDQPEPEPVQRIRQTGGL